MNNFYRNNYSSLTYGNNNSLNSPSTADKNAPSNSLNNGLVMVTALSASGIGRVVGVQAGLDIIDDWSKKKAKEQAKDNLQKEQELIDKLNKKFKVPVTLLTSTIGVLMGFALVLAPVFLIHKKKEN